MDAEKANYPIALMARVLKVTRAGYYAWRSRRVVRQERSDKQFSFDMSVAWFFNQYDQTHGAPRLTAVLARNGIHADKKTVAASLRRQGLQAVSRAVLLIRFLSLPEMICLYIMSLPC